MPVHVNICDSVHVPNRNTNKLTHTTPHHTRVNTQQTKQTKIHAYYKSISTASATRHEELNPFRKTSGASVSCAINSHERDKCPLHYNDT